MKVTTCKVTDNKTGDDQGLDFLDAVKATNEGKQHLGETSGMDEKPSV